MISITKAFNSVGISRRKGGGEKSNTLAEELHSGRLARAGMDDWQRR